MCKRAIIERAKYEHLLQFGNSNGATNPRNRNQNRKLHRELFLRSLCNYRRGFRVLAAGFEDL